MVTGFIKKRIERLRNVFLVTFLFLIITIIFTPLLIRKGSSFASEEIFEAIFLLIQVSVAWNIFRLYEQAVQSREKEINLLEREYQKREKELLEAFAYLGKVNVQMNLAKDFMRKLKAPRNKKEVKEYFDDILHMALAISKRRWILVRVINTHNLKTISENLARNKSFPNIPDIKIGNREIIEMAEKKENCDQKNICALSSAGSIPYEEKAFLVFEEGDGVDQEVMDFLKAAVNQCEIIHTLFVLGHGKK